MPAQHQIAAAEQIDTTRHVAGNAPRLMASSMTITATSDRSARKSIITNASTVLRDKGVLGFFGGKE